MESKSLLFKTFFDPLSGDVNYRFSAKGLLLALQVFRIVENRVYNDVDLSSELVEVSEMEVETMKSNFNKIVCLMENSHEARKKIGTAFRAKNHGIAASSSVEWNWGIKDAIAVIFKAAIGAVLLGIYLHSASLLAAVSTISTVIVFGGLAVGAWIVVLEYHKTDVEATSLEDIEDPITTVVDDNEYHWNIWNTFTTAFNVIGGSILLGTLMYPSSALAILSALCTLVFFGGLAAITVAIVFYELPLGDKKSEDAKTYGTLKYENDKGISVRSWFQCTNELTKALKDLIGPEANAYSLVINFKLLSKEQEDLKSEVWLKKYLLSTNSLCMLVQQKYGVLLTPVVIAFILVILIFHDRNRFILESALKTRHFISNSANLRRKPYCATDSISFDSNEYLNEICREILKNSDLFYKSGFEVETYNFEVPLGRNTQFDVNKKHKIRQLKEVRNQTTHERNTKKLDKSISKKQQVQHSSNGLESKQIDSDVVCERNTKELDEHTFKNQQEHSLSNGLVSKRTNSNVVCERITKELDERTFKKQQERSLSNGLESKRTNSNVVCERITKELDERTFKKQQEHSLSNGLESKRTNSNVVCERITKELDERTFKKQQEHSLSNGLESKRTNSNVVCERITKELDERTFKKQQEHSLSNGLESKRTNSNVVCERITKELDERTFKKQQEHSLSNGLESKRTNSNVVCERITKELDERTFKKQQEHSLSNGLESKRTTSKAVEKYTRIEITEFMRATGLETKECKNNIEPAHEKTISEPNGQITVKSEKNKKNEITHDSQIKIPKDPGKLTVEKKHRRIGSFTRRSSPAYNRLVRKHERETNDMTVSYTRNCIPEEKSNELNINSGTFIQDSSLNKVKKEVQGELSSVSDQPENAEKDSQKGFVNLSNFPAFDKERRTQTNKQRRSSFQKLDKEHQNTEVADSCGCFFQVAEVERSRMFDIQQDEDTDEEIPTLEELEERLECLLDDGPRVNQWLIDLEERFKNLF